MHVAQTRSAGTGVRQSKAPAAAQQVKHTDTVRKAMAQVKVPTVKGKDLGEIGSGLRYGAPDNFDYLGAASSGFDYAKVGSIVGAGAGCLAGIGAALFTLNPELAPGGCIVGGNYGATGGAVIMGAIGFVKGGYHMRGADSLSQ